MTIDEAINNFTEAAKNHREEQQYWLNERDETSPLYEADRLSLADDSRESAEYYEQLAEWLTELKDLREEYANLNKISYGYYKELKEAKRLLKMAVSIINNSFPEVGSCWGCANHDEVNDECKEGAFAECADVCKWKYADEALKLMGETNDEP